MPFQILLNYIFFLANNSKLGKYMSKIELTPLKYFMNEKISVVEIQLLEADGSTWIQVCVDDSQGSYLKLEKSFNEVINGNDIQVRVFANGELRFDDKFGKFQYGGDGHIVMRLPVKELPVEVTKKIGILLTQ
jgi:hypothetical protein